MTPDKRNDTGQTVNTGTILSAMSGAGGLIARVREVVTGADG
jgi:hypothetical protein